MALHDIVLRTTLSFYLRGSQGYVIEKQPEESPILAPRGSSSQVWGSPLTWSLKATQKTIVWYRATYILLPQCSF